MSATTIPGFSSSAASAFDGASSASRSGRSSHPAPPTPITGANTRPLTGCRRCASTSATKPSERTRTSAVVRVNMKYFPIVMTLSARAASPGDIPAIAEIYNEGIEDRIGTFETRPRSADDVRGWFDGVHPIVVVEDEGGRVVAFASTSAYRSSRVLRRHCRVFGLRGAPRTRTRGRPGCHGGAD